MNQINQSAVRTIPSHAGISRRMTPHMNTPCKFFAAQTKPSRCHICNMATWSILPRVLPHWFLPYSPSQGSSPANEKSRAAEQCSPEEQCSQAITEAGSLCCWHTAALGTTGWHPASGCVYGWLSQEGWAGYDPLPGLISCHSYSPIKNNVLVGVLKLQVINVYWLPLFALSCSCLINNEGKDDRMIGLLFFTSPSVILMVHK